MPSSAVHTFTDPDAYFSRIRHMPTEGVVLQRGEFRAESALIDLHRLLMYRSDEDLPRIMRVTRPREGLRSLIIFATSADQPETIINGVETSQNQIATLGLDLQLYLRSSTHCKWGSMSLTAEDLAAAGETIIGRELVLPPLINTVAPSPLDLLRLRKLHDAAGHLAQSAPDILAKPEVARAMEQALVEAMAFCLRDSHSDQVRNVRGHRARVMRRLEEVLMANPEEPLYMAELSARVGASYWALRDCCLEYLGMSPKRYLWLRRMNLARRALRRANAETKTVTEIASDYGFWELGRFSVAYRSLFGESPSKTLDRAP